MALPRYPVCAETRLYGRTLKTAPIPAPPADGWRRTRRHSVSPQETALCSWLEIDSSTESERFVGSWRPNLRSL